MYDFQFVVGKCSKCLELAARILIRAMKIIDKSEDIKIDVWLTIIKTIDINDVSTLWTNLINCIADLTPKNVENCLTKLLEFWMSEFESIEIQTIPHKLEVVSKILHLARGKKIKMENSVRQFICTFACKSQEESGEILQKMTALVINLCAAPNQSAVDILKDLLNLEKLGVDQKVQLLFPIVENDLFETSFKTKLVQCLIKHKNSVRKKLIYFHFQKLFLHVSKFQ